MLEALIAKFDQHIDLRAQLLLTGEALIVEHVNRDKYWGDGGDEGTGAKGLNMLGKLLM